VDIYTIAGAGSAQLSNPLSVAATGAGDLLIAGSGNNRIREIAG
jgi:hypothetical protein